MEEREEALALFCSVTDAPRGERRARAARQGGRPRRSASPTPPAARPPARPPAPGAGVAEHVLDAHHWDVNNAVAFYVSIF